MTDWTWTVSASPTPYADLALLLTNAREMWPDGIDLDTQWQRFCFLLYL
ncbi:hypothetical protein [Kribbella sp. CA-293567]|nr:hypothetical protein [Kribbella sp. CA-293567]WBQ04736.1 hypothetical protein OX958_32850 [Kribbella sp. CA-293567]